MKTSYKKIPDIYVAMYTMQNNEPFNMQFLFIFNNNKQYIYIYIFIYLYKLCNISDAIIQINMRGILTKTHLDPCLSTISEIEQ